MPDIKLVIRDAQMNVFSELIMRRWIMDYLVSCYPQRAEAMGRKALAGLVEAGTGAARKRRINAPEDIRKYVHIMFLLGMDFEDDPKCRWARKILDDPKYRLEAARLRELEDGVLGLTQDIASIGVN
jgi:hypothetical protein